MITILLVSNFNSFLFLINNLANRSFYWIHFSDYLFQLIKISQFHLNSHFLLKLTKAEKPLNRLHPFLNAFYNYLYHPKFTLIMIPKILFFPYIHALWFKIRRFLSWEPFQCFVHYILPFRAFLGAYFFLLNVSAKFLFFKDL